MNYSKMNDIINEYVIYITFIDANHIPILNFISPCHVCTVSINRNTPGLRDFSLIQRDKFLIHFKKGEM